MILNVVVQNILKKIIAKEKLFVAIGIAALTITTIVLCSKAKLRKRWKTWQLK